MKPNCLSDRVCLGPPKESRRLYYRTLISLKSTLQSNFDDQNTIDNIVKYFDINKNIDIIQEAMNITYNKRGSYNDNIRKMTKLNQELSNKGAYIDTIKRVIAYLNNEYQKDTTQSDEDMNIFKPDFWSAKLKEISHITVSSICSGLTGDLLFTVRSGLYDYYCFQDKTHDIPFPKMHDSDGRLEKIAPELDKPDL